VGEILLLFQLHFSFMPPNEKVVDSTPGTKETVIIFDWDDTLLASSFLSSKGYRLDSIAERIPEVDAQLKDLEQSVVSVLTTAISYGHVNIITNAETGWVQLSAKKFIPAVIPILDKVKVVSARSTYENSYPENPMQWKLCAFQDKLVKCFTTTNLERNVISFGDSHVEREAVLAVTRGLPNTRTKSVKFAERPSMEQLRRQIELVTSCFQYISSHDGDLDLQLTVTVNPQNESKQNTSTPNNPLGCGTPLASTPYRKECVVRS
jgi:hypothetical protein